MTALKSEYMKERRRVQKILQRIRAAGLERGIKFKIDFEMPAIPKKITEGSIRRLKKITAKSIRERTYAETSGGGLVRVDRTISKFIKREIKGRLIVDTFIESLGEFVGCSYYDIVIETIKYVSSVAGDDAVAKFIVSQYPMNKASLRDKRDYRDLRFRTVSGKEDGGEFHYLFMTRIRDLIPRELWEHPVYGPPEELKRRIEEAPKLLEEIELRKDYFENMKE